MVVLVDSQVFFQIIRFSFFQPLQLFLMDFSGCFQMFFVNRVVIGQCICQRFLKTFGWGFSPSQKKSTKGRSNGNELMGLSDPSVFFQVALPDGFSDVFRRADLPIFV